MFEEEAALVRPWSGAGSLAGRQWDQDSSRDRLAGVEAVTCDIQQPASRIYRQQGGDKAGGNVQLAAVCKLAKAATSQFAKGWRPLS